MGIPAALCILIGLISPWILPLLEPAIGILTGWPVETLQTPLSQGSSSLAVISAFGVTMWLGIFLLMQIRKAILKRRPVESSVTWDCGYAAPAARMQYTATSYAGPLTTLFGLLLQTRCHRQPPSGLFARPAPWKRIRPISSSDFLYSDLYRPVVDQPSG